MRRICLLISLFVVTYSLSAQELAGTWEEYTETRFTSYSKLCIAKICNKYYASMFDRDNDGGYCHTNIEATYNQKRKKLLAECVSFDDRTAGHVLGIYELYYRREAGVEILEGTVYEKPDSFYREIDGIRRLVIVDDPNPEEVRFVKTSNRVDSSAYMRLMAAKPCKSDPVFVKEPPKTTTTPEIETLKETTLKKAPDESSDSTNEAKVIRLRNRRTDDTVSVYRVTENELVIYVKDDAITDGDTISILHNGHLIADKIRVSSKSYPLKILLSKEDPVHELVLVAHNLGTIPPNTALLVFRFGNREYRLHAIADLGKNAVVIFEYAGD